MCWVCSYGVVNCEMCIRELAEEAEATERADKRKAIRRELRNVKRRARYAAKRDAEIAKRDAEMLAQVERIRATVQIHFSDLITRDANLDEQRTVFEKDTKLAAEPLYIPLSERANYRD